MNFRLVEIWGAKKPDVLFRPKRKRTLIPSRTSQLRALRWRNDAAPKKFKLTFRHPKVPQGEVIGVGQCFVAATGMCRRERRKCLRRRCVRESHEPFVATRHACRCPCSACPSPSPSDS